MISERPRSGSERRAFPTPLLSPEHSTLRRSTSRMKSPVAFSPFYYGRDPNITYVHDPLEEQLAPRCGVDPSSKVPNLSLSEPHAWPQTHEDTSRCWPPSPVSPMYQTPGSEFDALQQQQPLHEVLGPPDVPTAPAAPHPGYSFTSVTAPVSNQPSSDGGLGLWEVPTPPLSSSLVVAYGVQDVGAGSCSLLAGGETYNGSLSSDPSSHGWQYARFYEVQEHHQMEEITWQIDPETQALPYYYMNPPPRGETLSPFHSTYVDLSSDVCYEGVQPHHVDPNYIGVLSSGCGAPVNPPPLFTTPYHLPSFIQDLPPLPQHGDPSDPYHRSQAPLALASNAHCRHDAFSSAATIAPPVPVVGLPPPPVCSAYWSGSLSFQSHGRPQASELASSGFLSSISHQQLGAFASAGVNETTTAYPSPLSGEGSLPQSASWPTTSFFSVGDRSPAEDSSASQRGRRHTLLAASSFDPSWAISSPAAETSRLAIPAPAHPYSKPARLLKAKVKPKSMVETKEAVVQVSPGAASGAVAYSSILRSVSTSGAGSASVSEGGPPDASISSAGGIVWMRRLERAGRRTRGVPGKGKMKKAAKKTPDKGTDKNLDVKVTVT